MPPSKKTAHQRILWTSAHLKVLRQSAGRKPLAQIARELKRSSDAVQRKAYLEGISLRVRK